MDGIDLKQEQEATLARPPRRYGVLAKILFFKMDLLYGRKMSYAKMRILEILARIPYQAWEVRQYRSLDRRFGDGREVSVAEDIIRWGRKAQDNEFWHLQVVEDKVRRDGIRIGWLRAVLFPWGAAIVYNIASRLLAFFSIRTAFRLNADFEDHAEHEYMNFVRETPTLDTDAVTSEVVTREGPYATYADVFRRIALDERDHMNDSLVHAGLAAEVVPYASR